jgi:hypothetical protein
MVCVSPQGTQGDRSGDDRAWRRHTLAILKRLAEAHFVSWLL